jgi:apolipoprotein D and lipocalin family protein
MPLRRDVDAVRAARLEPVPPARFRRALAWTLSLAAGAIVSSQVVAADVKAVDSIDLNRYAGSWHEIAAIPQFFQRKCIRDTRATYTLTEGSLIRVENVCTREDGGKERAEGRARQADPAGTSKLEVTFLELFGEYRFWIAADYWVVALDPNYRWAVVGHPSRRYGWVLARDPRLSSATLAEIIGRIKLQGYDACEFQVTPQTGGLSVRRALCEVLP